MSWGADTGAAGFIGSHVVDRLLADGHEIVGVDSFTGYYPRARKLRNLRLASLEDGFRLVEGDLLGLDLRALLRGVDGVVHLAGEPGVRRSWADFDVYMERNVRATQRLLEAAWRTGSPRLVHASSSSVYGPDGGGLRAKTPPASPRRLMG
jgi:nucleoside-diphosphate-sugar epimerase